ncbi:hypothetical protein QQF64_035996 [Cirrhinus molitorella]|uniref:Uncharacterized protein n=1 Tax=Cirrhinus molitorella TaxID=172907 RepID=A0ABR3NHB7_9TELE
MPEAAQTTITRSGPVTVEQVSAQCFTAVGHTKQRQPGAGHTRAKLYSPMPILSRMRRRAAELGPSTTCYLGSQNYSLLVNDRELDSSY